MKTESYFGESPYYWVLFAMLIYFSVRTALAKPDLWYLDLPALFIAGYIWGWSGHLQVSK